MSSAPSLRLELHQVPRARRIPKRLRCDWRKAPKEFGKGTYRCQDCGDDQTGPNVDSAVRKLPRGTVLCIVRIRAIEPTTAAMREYISRREMIFGNYEDGRYAWHLQLLEKFDTPIPAKGNRMLWNCSRNGAAA